MRSVEFTVPGPPTPKARTRSVPLKKCGRCHRTTARRICICGNETDFKFVTNIEVTPTKTVQYESLVRLYAQSALANEHLLSGPLSFRAVCWFEVPKSRARKIGEGDPHTQRPDADNITKSLLDGCNGVLFHDDCAVYSVKVEKRWTHDRARAEVTVSEANLYEHKDLDEGER